VAQEDLAPRLVLRVLAAPQVCPVETLAMAQARERTVRGQHRVPAGLGAAPERRMVIPPDRATEVTLDLLITHPGAEVGMEEAAAMAMEELEEAVRRTSMAHWQQTHLYRHFRHRRTRGISFS